MLKIASLMQAAGLPVPTFRPTPAKERVKWLSLSREICHPQKSAMYVINKIRYPQKAFLKANSPCKYSLKCQLIATNPMVSAQVINESVNVCLKM